jgi:hypothetical protein
MIQILNSVLFLTIGYILGYHPCPSKIFKKLKKRVSNNKVKPGPIKLKSPREFTKEAKRDRELQKEFEKVAPLENVKKYS